MTYLSVCSGVEAASQAWEPLGWGAVAFSEIEPFPCAVLASRFPNVPNLGDMSRIHYDRNTTELYNDTTRIVCRDGIDLLVGGTPCQSFSVAGKRAGLEGASGLAYHYARLIGEIQPRWFVWENVPGALSSVTYGDQRDFNFLLQQFSVGGNADLGVRWNCCWRVLDTQYVRVESFPRAIPQRRRRVFVVGHLAADCGGGCEVLLEQEGVRGNPAPRRVKGQGAAGDIEARVGGADGAVGVVHGTMDPISNPCECANAIGRNDGAENCVALGFDPAPREVLKRQFEELQTTMQNGTCPGHHNAVAIRTANGVECLTPEQPMTHRVFSADGSSPTLFANSGGGQNQQSICVRTANTHANGQAVATPICFQQNQRCEVRDLGGAAGALQSEAGMKQQNYVALPVAMRGNRTPTDRGKFPETDGSGAAYSLTSVQTDPMVATAIGIDPYNSASTGDVSKTLNTAVAQDTDHTGAVAIGIDSYSLCGTGDVAMTVHGTKQDAEHMPAVAIGINGDCAGTLDSNYFKGCGERQGTEREVVAIGIGRDAFNSGKNAQVDKQMERNGSYLCGPI